MDNEQLEHLQISVDAIGDVVCQINERMDCLMSIQDDINAALAGDTAAIKALTDRVAGKDQALEDGLAAANAEIATLKASNPGIDVAALEASLAKIKTDADAVDAAPVVPPAGSPPTAAAKPLYTFTGPQPNTDPAWTKTNATAADGTPLYTFASDPAGGPATGDGLGGVWHVYVGAVSGTP